MQKKDVVGWLCAAVETASGKWPSFADLGRLSTKETLMMDMLLQGRSLVATSDLSRSRFTAKISDMA